MAGMAGYMHCKPNQSPLLLLFFLLGTHLAIVSHSAGIFVVAAVFTAAIVTTFESLRLICFKPDSSLHGIHGIDSVLNGRRRLSGQKTPNQARVACTAFGQRFRNTVHLMPAVLRLLSELFQLPNPYPHFNLPLPHIHTTTSTRSSGRFTPSTVCSPDALLIDSFPSLLITTSFGHPHSDLRGPTLRSQ